MGAAIEAAAEVRTSTSPNPWVGAAIVTDEGATITGATEPPGGRHAERVALDRVGDGAGGATMAVTLEPCSHQGRTGPCADAVIEAGVARVIVGVTDPDHQVTGQGIARLRAAGVTVEVGCEATRVERQLAAYLHHRCTGRPYVVLKLAATMDGRTSAPDGTSQWITGPEIRAEAHRLRAESDAILVGAGTVRADDPSLTVRHHEPEQHHPDVALDPRRIVLGHAPPSAKVHPCTEYRGPLDELLDRLGEEGVLQLMVEGGARVASDFHRAGLVDRYQLHLAPALFGGDDARGMFVGPGASTIGELWRANIDEVRHVGQDLLIELVPDASGRDVVQRDNQARNRRGV